MARIQQEYDPQVALKMLRVEQDTVKCDVSMNRMSSLILPAA